MNEFACPGEYGNGGDFSHPTDQQVESEKWSDSADAGHDADEVQEQMLMRAAVHVKSARMQRF